MQVFMQLAQLGLDPQSADGRPVDPLIERLPFKFAGPGSQPKTAHARNGAC